VTDVICGLLIKRSNFKRSKLVFFMRSKLFTKYV
jgi:hypothetical protein